MMQDFNGYINCPICNSKNLKIETKNATSAYSIYQCQDCKKWFTK